MTCEPARLPATGARTGAFLARFEAALVAAWDRFAERQEYRRGLLQLREMDAAQLKDVGVTRDEVDHLIHRSKTRGLI